MSDFFKRKKLRFICCEVFVRMASYAIAESPHTIDAVFLPKSEHNTPDRLRVTIQTLIDNTTDEYDAIILGYGLCGNAIIGLRTHGIPMIIPRAHDCCTIFLGSRKSFVDNFSNNFSAEWCSDGYMERGATTFTELNEESSEGNTKDGYPSGLGMTYEDYVEMYGEENAAYLYEMLSLKSHSQEIIYINNTDTKKLGWKKAAEQIATDRNSTFKELDGSSILIKKLCNSDWEGSDEFLIMEPYSEVEGIYDQTEIIFSKVLDKK